MNFVLGCFSCPYTLTVFNFGSSSAALLYRGRIQRSSDPIDGGMFKSSPSRIASTLRVLPPLNPVPSFPSAVTAEFSCCSHKSVRFLLSIGDNLSRNWPLARPEVRSRFLHLMLGCGVLFSCTRLGGSFSSDVAFIHLSARGTFRSKIDFEFGGGIVWDVALTISELGSGECSVPSHYNIFNSTRLRYQFSAMSDSES
jgi:hypothetical protein